MNLKAQILIPTYNRESYLRENLLLLKDHLTKDALTEDIGILVSDNASEDGTWSMLKELQQKWSGEIQMQILRNETNVGLEQQGSSSASAEHLSRETECG